MIDNIMLKTMALSNGETLAYREGGNGYHKLLLIHGNLASSLNWEGFIKALPEDFKAYAVDLRGFGDSSYNKPVASIKDHVQDIIEFINNVGLSNLTVVGWSAGGAVAMQLVIDYPDYAKRLILINSSSIKGYPVLKRNLMGRPIKNQYVKTRPEMQTLLRYIKNSFESKKTDTIKKILDSELYKIRKPDEASYKVYVDEVAKQRNIVEFNYALSVFNISHANNGVVDGNGEVDKITMPVLVIQGEKDTLVTMDMAKEICEGIGENAELTVLKDCGHVPFVDNLNDLMGSVVKFIGW